MVLVTGAAGFIGFHVAKKLLDRGDEVLGIDNINSYYDPALKEARLAILTSYRRFVFEKLDICDRAGLDALFRRFHLDRVCHLAAQAGVRHSLTDPWSYQKSNGEGFLNIVELVRTYRPENFVYASSSSVYGANTKLPFSEDDPTDAPVSLYAATKKANELVAHCYRHLYGIPATGLRFFTVYGPWGRPDMALFKFTKAILGGEAIEVYNNGLMRRNFTYIDDIVAGVLLTLDRVAPDEVYNIGNDRAEQLMDFIAEIEKNCGKKADIRFLPMQPGDVVDTVADIGKLMALGYDPKTNIDRGVAAFVEWYRGYIDMQGKLF
jgi:UDP-glucuronate 4-epimerase